MKRSKKTVGLIAAGILALGGIGAGAYASTGDDSGTTAASSSASTTTSQGAPDQAQGDVVDGTEADKVEAAVLAKYSGATVEQVTVDSDGVYHAMAMSNDGEPMLVTVSAAFEVTGSETPQGPPGGGQGEGDGQQGPPSNSAGEAATPATAA